MTALYLNPVFKAPSVHKYDTQDYRHVDGSLAVTRRCCGCGTTRKEGMRLILDGVFNHSGDSHAWLTATISRGAHTTTRIRRSATGTVLTKWPALDWLGYPSLPKLDFQSPSLVNEIYGGDDSIVRHWLKAPWNMDGWRLDVVHMLGEAGGARNNLQDVAAITRLAKRPGRKLLSAALWRRAPVVAG
ncbi:alpha-amylase family glycosyl hydrolase [Shigella flexneri]